MREAFADLNARLDQLTRQLDRVAQISAATAAGPRNEEPPRQLIASHHPEVVCVCAFGALIKEPLLSAYETSKAFRLLHRHERVIESRR